MTARRKWLWRSAQLLLLVLVAWGIYRALAPELARLSRDDVLAYRPSWPLLALSTVLLLVVYLLHALLWRGITIALGKTRIPLGDALRVYFVSSLGRYLPGKLWQIAGLAVLAQRAGISAVAATAAALLGQLAFLCMGMVLLAALLPSLYGRWAVWSALILFAIALVLFVLGDTKQGAAWRHRLLSRLGPRVAEAGALLDQLTARRALWWWFAYGLSWVLLGVAFALFVIAFVPARADQYRHFAGTVAASYLVGLLLFTPAGIGTREGVMLLLLAPVISAPAAVLVSVASRIWFTVGELLPVAFVPWLKGNAPIAKEGAA